MDVDQDEETRQLMDALLKAVDEPDPLQLINDVWLKNKERVVRSVYRPSPFLQSLR